MTYFNNAYSTPAIGTKVYAEVHCDAAAGAVVFGVADNSLVGDTGLGVGDVSSSTGWHNNGGIHSGGITVGAIGTFAAGDRLALALDLAGLKIYFRNITQGGNWSTGYTIGNSGEVYLVTSLSSGGDAFTVNFDGTFAGAPPDSTYTRWDGSALLVGVIFVGGGYSTWRQPLVELVEGVGHGMLPRLHGDAHGVVAGVRIAIPVAGEAAGTAGIAGHSRALLSIRVAAAGYHGQAGALNMVILAPACAAGFGVICARGKGSGMVANPAGTGSGRHDDDDPALIAWMLAA